MALKDKHVQQAMDRKNVAGKHPKPRQRNNAKAYVRAPSDRALLAPIVATVLVLDVEQYPELDLEDDQPLCILR
jgi:hypothetical protein